MITEITGDLLDVAAEGRVDVIVHQANLMHTFGAGIARAILTRFPYAFEADRRTGRGDKNKLGHFSIGVPDDNKLPVVVNLYSQTSLYPSHTSYDNIFEGLTELCATLEPITSVTRIGFPFQMGCGLADGNWRIVRTIIEEVFRDSRFEIVIVQLPEKQSDPLST